MNKFMTREQLKAHFMKFVFGECPSGMPHYIVGGVVTNCKGSQYCYHKDCFASNKREVGIE